MGSSLRDDFSEIDIEDSKQLQEAVAEYQKQTQALGEPDLKAPFLPPIQQNYEYTLVLDLDETLVHYDEGTEVLNVRPNLHQFLDKVSRYYEIVIFTAGMKEYADWALSELGDIVRHTVSHRLYRNHALPCREFYIKDLSLLGRDLNKTIIVDNITENFLLQPENGISIKSWYEDPEDDALMQLAPFLVSIVQQQEPDVKVTLKQIKESIIEMICEEDSRSSDSQVNLYLD